MVLEHPMNLAGSCAGDAQLGQGVFAEEIDPIGFRAQLRRSPEELTEKEHLVDVERERRLVWMFASIENGEQFLGTHFETRFLEYLSNRIPDYSFDEVFGGVFYLFMRGVSPEHPDSGIWHFRPTEDFMNDLSAFFIRRAEVTA